MDLSKFGDSYDIVKQSLLHWLNPLGPWACHPMFREVVEEKKRDKFERFLGVELLSSEPIIRNGRKRFFETAKSWNKNLLLDPTTGLSVPSRETKRSFYLMGTELVEIAQARPGKLTLVFDQSIPRSNWSTQQECVKEKLAWLQGKNLSSIAYFSHANFILVSSDNEVLNSAKNTLLQASNLPHFRILEVSQS